MSTLNDKKAALEKLRKEVEEQEALEKEKKDRTDAHNKGYYKPLKSAIVKHNIYYCSEYDFAEIGDGDWYRVDEILGEPTFKKDAEVVLIAAGEDFQNWYLKREDNDYYCIDENECGMENNESNQRYLKNIKEI